MEHLMCKSCKAIAVDGECPLCGRTKRFVEPKPNDTVYLTSCEYNWSSVIENVLDDADISYYRHGVLGNGVVAVVGEMRELYRYYVAYSDYETASMIVPDISDGVMTEEELLEYIDSEAEFSEYDGEV